MGVGKAPVHIKRSIGGQNVVKGTSKGVQFASLDIVESCSGENCPLVDQCEYDKDPDKQCRMQLDYLGAVAGKLLKVMKSGSEEDSIRIGLLMMPLFAHMAKLKIAEYDTPVFVHTKNGVKINPLLKEIRETSKTIDGILGKLGGDGRGIGGDGSNKDGLGEPGYYESLFEDVVNPNDESDKKEKKIKYSRRNRRVKK